MGQARARGSFKGRKENAIERDLIIHGIAENLAMQTYLAAEQKGMTLKHGNKTVDVIKKDLKSGKLEPWDFFDTVEKGTPESGAIFSDCEKYRYVLWRHWDLSKPHVLWILLNPSTADESVLDPTLTRCMNFSKSWGYGGFRVCNIFGYRSTNPKDMLSIENPVGLGNDYHIEQESIKADMIILGWGNHGGHLQRNAFVKKYLQFVIGFKPVYALKVTKTMEPSHPLYLKSDLKPVRYLLQT